MNRLALTGLISLVLAAPAVAQDMSHMSMPGTTPPAAGSAASPASAPPAVDPHAGHDMAGETAAPEAGEIPKTPPPPPPSDYAADRYFDPAAMAGARATLRLEHGGAPLSKVMASLAEYQARPGGEAGYRWEGRAWYGGDINRFLVKSEGEGARRGGLDSAEIQALYSHAIGPYFDLQAGVRQDFKPRGRTYATLGVEGLAPYWFDVSGAVFLSDQGDLLGRVEAAYDLRLTQRLILQPRAELNLAAQDRPASRTGSGPSNAELGLRLRYEVRREFAPYVGVSYDRKFGGTAGYARRLGEDVETTSLVVGVRAFF